MRATRGASASVDPKMHGVTVATFSCTKHSMCPGLSALPKPALGMTDPASSGFSQPVLTAAPKHSGGSTAIVRSSAAAASYFGFCSWKTPSTSSAESTIDPRTNA